MKKRLAISGMSCQHCVHAVKEALADLDGVTVSEVQLGSAEVDLASSEYDQNTLSAAIEEEGFKLTGVEDI
jgi:copper chaperone